jgi:hypothetical protein
LVAVIVDAAELADLPADGHALEDLVLENEVASVISLGEEEVIFQRLGKHGVLQDVILNCIERELVFGNGRQACNPLADGELPGRDFHLFVHVGASRVSKQGSSPNYSARRERSRASNRKILTEEQILYLFNDSKRRTGANSGPQFVK